MKAFAESAHRASNINNAVIVAGGANQDLKKGSPSPSIHRKFMDDINDVGWEQMVQDPMRGENYLDLFLTNHPNLVPRTEVLPGLADHDAVYKELQIHPPKKYQPKRFIPIYTKDCNQPLKDAARQLNNRIMSIFHEHSGVEDIWTELKTGLSQALTEYVPHKQTK